MCKDLSYLLRQQESRARLQHRLLARGEELLTLFLLLVFVFQLLAISYTLPASPVEKLLAKEWCIQLVAAVRFGVG